MTRVWTIALAALILLAALPASAQDLVSPKLLRPVAGLRIGTSHFNATLETPPPQDQPVVHKHWTRKGKILTIVGGALAADGLATVAYYEANNSSCNSNLNACLSSGWKWGGVAEASAGGALMVIGLTRRSTD